VCVFVCVCKLCVCVPVSLSEQKLEMAHGSKGSVESLLRRAVQYCPQVRACVCVSE